MQPSKKKHIIDKNLEDWLKDRSSIDFPTTKSEKDTYPKRYEDVSSNLEEIHSEVEKGALLQSAMDLLQKGEISVDQLIYLNNHGKEHVKTVISRATDLLGKSKCELTAYEGYLLLMAIQFHDVGIVFGRTGHEKRCWEIMREMGNKAGLDKVEQRNIIQIASVHGGAIGDNKDTISQLSDEVDLMGHQGVRISFLAAILRFADELSDDNLRSSSYLKDKGRIPCGSEIFHEYSACLHSVIITEKEINLSYELQAENVLKQYKVNGEEKYLLDEIYARTLKMHCERIYCSRFLRHYIKIDKIGVKIEIYFGEDVLDSKKITYHLCEKGYPSHLSSHIYDLCPELKGSSGEKMKQLMEELGA